LEFSRGQPAYVRSSRERRASSSSLLPAQAYCRHSAFKAYFARLDYRWYLSVTPTYHFTSDGRWPSRRGEFLSNAKRRERNDSVRQQLEMWARYLTGVADYAPPEYPLLVLAAPLAVEVDAGIDDKAWLRQDDEAVEGESEPWGCRYSDMRRLTGLADGSSRLRSAGPRGTKRCQENGSNRRYCIAR
jgi:hypothetical protein